MPTPIYRNLNKQHICPFSSVCLDYNNLSSHPFVTITDTTPPQQTGNWLNPFWHRLQRLHDKQQMMKWSPVGKIIAFIMGDLILSLIVSKYIVSKLFYAGMSEWRFSLWWCKNFKPVFREMNQNSGQKSTTRSPTGVYDILFLALHFVQ